MLGALFANAEKDDYVGRIQFERPSHQLGAGNQIEKNLTEQLNLTSLQLKGKSVLE